MVMVCFHTVIPCNFSKPASEKLFLNHLEMNRYQICIFKAVFAKEFSLRSVVLCRSSRVLHLAKKFGRHCCQES